MADRRGFTNLYQNIPVQPLSGYSDPSAFIRVREAIRGVEDQLVQIRGLVGTSSPGFVTSVGLTAPTIFTVTGSPVTTSGTIALALASQAARSVFAAPTSGAGTPAFRALEAADIQSGVFGVSRGGTGLSTYVAGDILYSDATNSLAKLPVGSTGEVLKVAGGVPTWAADVGFANPMTTLGDLIYGDTAGAAARLAGNTTTTRQFLRQTGTGSASAAPAWDTVTKTDVGLGNVEDTALSTWGGSTNLVTLGTVTTGTWNATKVNVNYGGTGLTSVAANALLIGSTATSLGTIGPPGSAGTFFLSYSSTLPGYQWTDTIGVADGGTGQSSYTDGELLIGKTAGNTLNKTTLTAGSGVTILNGSGTITISATGSGGTVTGVTATAPILSSGGTTPDISLSPRGAYIESGSPSTNLAIGWYTIAVCGASSEGRAIGRFGVRDVASGRHQSLVFYAMFHFANGMGINILENGYFATQVITGVRIKYSTNGTTPPNGIYAGAMLQVYVATATNTLTGFLLDDNFHSLSGWTYKNFIADGTDPGDLNAWSDIQANPGEVYPEADESLNSTTGLSALYRGGGGYAVNQNAGLGFIVNNTSTGSSAQTIIRGVANASRIELVGYSSNRTATTNFDGPNVGAVRATGAGGMALVSDGGNFRAFVGSTASTGERLRITTTGVAILGYGEGTTTPVGNFFRAPSGVGTDVTGGTLSIAGGQGTGTGAGGPLTFWTAPAGASSGSAGNSIVERMRITSAGLVGIGTASPRNNLEVGNTTSNQTIRVGGIYRGPGTGYTGLGQETTRHQVVFSSWRDVVTDTIGAKIVAINKTAYNVSPNWDAVQYTDLAFFTLGTTPATADNTTEKMRLTSAGLLGIGTTSPSARLHLAAGTATVAPLMLTSGTNLTTAVAGAVEFDGTSLYVTNSTPARKTVAFTDSNITGTAANVTGIVAIANGGTNLSTAPTDGQLLIGSTSTGAYTLANLTAGSGVSISNAAGAITISATGSGGTVTSVTATSPVASTGGTTPVISLGTVGVANGGTGQTSYTIGDMLYADTTTTLAKLPLVSAGIMYGGASAPAWTATADLTWDNTNKRLGIGTASPGWPLHITKTQNADTQVRITNLDTGANAVATFLLAAAGANAGFEMAGSGASSPNLAKLYNAGSSGILIQADNASGRISFRTGGSLSTNERMRITSDGLVGIGTTGPGYALDVARTITTMAVGNAVIRGILTANPAASTTIETVEAVTGQAVLNGSANNFAARVSGGLFSLSHTGTGTITRADGVTINGFSKGTMGTVTALSGLRVNSPAVTMGTVTSAYGVYIDTQDTANVTTGYGVYQASTVDLNVLAGKVRIGSTTNPTNALDVTGSATVSTDLTVSGAASVAGALTLTTVNLGYSTSGLQLRSSVAGASSSTDYFFHRGADTTVKDRIVVHTPNISGAAFAYMTSGGVTRFYCDGFNGTLILGSGDLTTTPTGNTFRGPSGSGTNIIGGDLTITSGNGTGTGGSGSIIFQTASAGTTGSTANSMTKRLSVDKPGNVIVGSTAGSLATTATDGFLYIPSMAGVPTGSATAYTGTVAMVVDTSSGAGAGRLYIRVGSTWRYVALT